MSQQPHPNATSEEVIMTELVLPQHTNAIGSIFGGVVMSWIDIAGAIAAQKYCRRACVTASVDDLHFLAPIKKGWIVHLKARVNCTSRTSMEIGVRVDAEDPMTGEKHHTSSAYLTFVALDSNSRPVKVPEFVPQTEDEKRRFEDALKRRELRLRRRKSAGT